MKGPAEERTVSRHGYVRRLSRRESLRRMGILSAAAAAGLVPASAPASAPEVAPTDEYAPWPELELKPVTATGYGKDPNLITPAPAPWSRLLADGQLALVAVLADLIVPREGDVPSASEVGVVDVVDEWLSAPYPAQQEDRAIIEPGLRWIDAEASRRFGIAFVDLSGRQQRAILDEIAFAERGTPPALERPKAFFSTLRALVVGAFFTSPEGVTDLGYIGNVPIHADYPGPTPEAMAHLDTLLDELGLGRD